jgi:hypothetical protein
MTASATPALQFAPDQATRGREAAGRLWRHGLEAAVEDPLDAEFAAAAVAEFGQLQRDRTPGIYRDALAGAELSAEELNVEPFHCFLEVVQNADDVHARALRLAVRTHSSGRDLLFVHDGDPVRLPELVAMAIAFVSTKRDDARSKGRFGYGLKTLRRIGDTLTVHCGPYHASITGNQIAVVPAANMIEGFFRPDAGETLLELRLRSGFDAAEFKRWLSGWDASSMIFLDSVRALTLLNLRSRKPLVELRLEERSSSTRMLDVGRHSLPCTETIFREGVDKRTWRRYTVERPVPPSAPKRKLKAIDKTTPLAVAIPADDRGAGRLFAGLPLAKELGAPFSLNAQFNIDMPRTGVQHDAWNGWLLERLVELVGAVAAQRFASQAASGWAAVPLVAEAAAISDKWLSERLAAGARSVQGRLARSGRLEIGGPRRFRELVYEERPLERLLDSDDLERLYPTFVALPRAARDRSGRWRAVLAELEQGTQVSVVDSLRLLDDDAVDERPVSWFIRFARAAISADEGESLWWRRAIVLADGTRIVPPSPAVEAEVLIRRARPDSLATRLGLARVIHPAYLSENPEAAAVRRWLEDSSILVDDIGDEPALRALAQRGSNGEAEPLALDDRELMALRDALFAIERDDQEALGPEIGKAITVRGFRWERGKRRRTNVCPAKAYLPATLEDRSDGWSKAAGTVPGLAWIETGYANVLRRAKGDRRRHAALSFFRLLGADVAPRLVEPQLFDTRHGDRASPIDFVALTPSQRAPLAGAHATHLKGEQLSPDLARVVNDISRERARRRRRERARALLATLDREWQRLYDGHETAAAVYSSYSWVPATTLPASWLATARDTPWLTTESGAASCRRELVVRTPQTEALYGRDASMFAADVSGDMAASAAVRALQLTTDPRISKVVDELVKLRSEGDEVDATAVAVRYAAIAAAVRNVDAPLDSTVGDLTVRKLRGRFGSHRRKPGLILVDGRWLAPAQVLRGKPIFGRHRAFVPERSHADRLWRILGVRTPSITDCVAFLKQIAGTAPSAEDEQILLNTYVYLAEHLAEASRAERHALAELPLWSGERWLATRPIYVIDDAEVGRELTRKLPVWQPPIAPRSLGPLLGALNVTSLDDRNFKARVGGVERLAGEDLEETFAAAVAHLREWLARHDPALYESLEVGWDKLTDGKVAVAPKLELELRLPGRRLMRVAARAHVSRNPLQLAVADEDDAGADDAGGRAVAALFGGGDRDKVALAWATSWSRALKGDRSACLRLAEEEDDEDELASLFEQAASVTSAKTRPARGSKATSSASKSAATAPSPELIAAVRRLKSPDDLGGVTSVSRPEGSATARPLRGSRGLRTDEPSGKPIDASARPAPRSAPRAYSPQEQEHLALIALHRAINGELSGLTDFRHLQGVGADALDRLKRAFEIKSFATAMPNRVELNANEFKRALTDGRKYYLAVVAGLEEGYETVVRVIADPVHVLTVQKATKLVLGGVLTARKPIEVRFGTVEGHDRD